MTTPSSCDARSALQLLLFRSMCKCLTLALPSPCLGAILWQDADEKCKQYRSRLALDGGFRAQEDWYLTVHACLCSC